MTERNWDVLRDDLGAPITITPEQLRAVWRAVDVWRQVCEAEGNVRDFSQHNLGKSRLLGRMLIDGRPPLDEAPPEWLGGPDYHSVEPDLEHYYLNVSPRIVKVNLGGE